MYRRSKNEAKRCKLLHTEQWLHERPRDITIIRMGFRWCVSSFMAMISDSVLGGSWGQHVRFIVLFLLASNDIWRHCTSKLMCAAMLSKPVHIPTLNLSSKLHNRLETTGTVQSASGFDCLYYNTCFCWIFTSLLGKWSNSTLEEPRLLPSHRPVRSMYWYIPCQSSTHFTKFHIISSSGRRYWWQFFN